MKVIGILGGVASGKSLVAEQLRRLGAVVLDGDQVAHQVLRETDVIDAVRQRWGDSVIAEDGQINRAVVADIVFAPPPDGPIQLAYLEQITHPRIELRLRRRLTELEQAGDVNAVVLDAAVMLKAGWDKFCQHIIFVDTPLQIREERASKRGWSKAKFEAREAAQESLTVKRKAATVTINNSGPPAETRRQIEAFWNSLT